MIVRVGMLRVRTYDISNHAHIPSKSLQARFAVCTSVWVCVGKGIFASLTLSVVSDIRWLAEHDTSLTVKVPTVWEHDVGEKWGRYDGENERTIQEGFEQRERCQKSITGCK